MKGFCGRLLRTQPPIMSSTTLRRGAVDIVGSVSQMETFAESNVGSFDVFLTAVPLAHHLQGSFVDVQRSLTQGPTSDNRWSSLSTLETTLDQYDGGMFRGYIVSSATQAMSHKLLGDCRARGGACPRVLLQAPHSQIWSCAVWMRRWLTSAPVGQSATHATLMISRYLVDFGQGASFEG